MSLSYVLQLLYDHEINVSLTSFWDGGWSVCLGDETNGYDVIGDGFYDLDKLAEWTFHQAFLAYPEFAKAQGVK